MIDHDYDLLSGQPVIRQIYHLGGWYKVVATDIGRAPRPERPRTGDEQLEQRERFDIDTRHSQDKRAFVRRAIIDRLREHPEGLNVRQLADMTGINAKQITDTLAKNKHIFDTHLVARRGGGGRITVARLNSTV